MVNLTPGLIEQINALGRDPFGTGEFQDIPAVDLGEFSLRPLIEVVKASSTKPFDLQANIDIEGDGFITDSETLVPNEIDDALEEAVSDIRLLIDSLTFLRLQSASLILEDVSSADNSIPHLDSQERVKVLSAYPNNTLFLKNDWRFPATDIKQLTFGGNLTPQAIATIKVSDWFTKEEHAFATSMSGTVHRRRPGNPETIGHSHRALMQLSFLPAVAPLTYREEQRALRAGLL